MGPGVVSALLGQNSPKMHGGSRAVSSFDLGPGPVSPVLGRFLKQDRRRGSGIFQTGGRELFRRGVRTGCPESEAQGTQTQNAPL